MLRHDFHLHTRFSVDSQAEPRDYCLRALERGYRAICLTDHADFVPKDPGYGFFSYERYRRAVLACRDEFRGQLVVGFGIEIDYHQSWEHEIRSFLVDKEFDYILGGVHYLGDHTSVMEERCFAGLSQREAYEAYFREVLHLAESGLCQGLAHLDMIKRVGQRIYGRYAAEEYADSILPILAAAIRHGIALEINLSGCRKDLGPLPGLDVLDLYAQVGGSLITIGSDAHRVGNACPERPEIWDHVAEKGFVLWEPFPGFWTKG